MRLLRTEKERLVFQLSAAEKMVLVELLGLYPRVPPAHQRLTRKTRDVADAERQRLLDEALAEQRARIRRQVQSLLKRAGAFQQTAKGWEFNLRRRDAEWLLQVLNDVRVGSWIALGAPEELPRQVPAAEGEARLVAVMEIAGLFQSALLDALEGETAA